MPPAALELGFAVLITIVLAVTAAVLFAAAEESQADPATLRLLSVMCIVGAVMFVLLVLVQPFRFLAGLP